jgi:hypothetical protein
MRQILFSGCGVETECSYSYLINDYIYIKSVEYNLTLVGVVICDFF